MILILSIALSVFILVFIREWAGFMTYGRFVSEEELDLFFEKYMERYKEQRLESVKRGFSRFYHGPQELPFIAQSDMSTSAWHINDYGSIPRWSKWSKELTEFFEATKSEVKKKTLRDLI